MQLRWDQEANALYIAIRGDTPSSRTVEIDSGTLIDVDRLGEVIGIEILNPAREWPLAEILTQFRVPPEDAQALQRLLATDAFDQRYPYAPTGAERVAVA
jgi:uncharacterized protein YuzE